MRGLNLYLLIVSLLVIPATQSLGVTVTLQPGQSIQTAIDSATDGDEIVLRQGTYDGGISFKGKAVKVRSIEPEDSSIVALTVLNETGFNETGFNSIVTFNSGEGLDSILDGLTISGAEKGDGGISIRSASPTIQACVISYNTTPTGAGGITCASGSPVIRKTIFRDNQGYLTGGLLLSGNSHPSFDNCVFNNNTSEYDGGGINIGSTASVSLLRCTFEDNTANIHGGGIVSTGKDSEFKNCIFYDNKADFGTSVHCWGDTGTVFRNCIFTSKADVDLDWATIYCEDGSSSFINCTIAGNSSTKNDSAIDIDGNCYAKFMNCIIWNPGYKYSSSRVSGLTYSCVRGYSSSGTCISKDPMFVDATNLDFHLLDSSPCIDSGTTDTDSNDGCIAPGLDGRRNDMGAYGGPGNCLWEEFKTPGEPTPTQTNTSTITQTPTNTKTPTFTRTITPTPTYRGVIIKVHPGQSIQNAINGALYGDEIELAPGRYSETIKITQKDLILRSQDPSDPKVVSSWCNILSVNWFPLS